LKRKNEPLPKVDLMKRISLLLITTIAAAILAGQNKSPESMLGAALHQEEVQGDLNGAIAAYNKLLATRGLSHSVAAEALYHLGLCYQKLGDAGSRRAFQRLVAEYPDQTRWVTQARAKIAAMGGGASRGNQSTKLVWKDQKLSLDGGVSNDGRLLSYVDWSTGNLLVHDLVTGADRPITTTGSWKPGEREHAMESAISRDGKQVAYSWWREKSRNDELYVANLVGDPHPRLLYEGEELPWIAAGDWSSDGRRIAVTLKGYLQTSDQSTVKGAVGLVSAQNGGLRVLKTMDLRVSGEYLGRPYSSPDGKYLAYDRGFIEPTRKLSKVFVLSIDDQREIPVMAGSGQEEIVGWSPDGKYLLFTSNRTGSVDLWALAFVNGTVAGEPQVIRPSTGRVTTLGLTTNGALYYGVQPTRELLRSSIAEFDFTTGRLLSPLKDVNEEEDAEGSPFADWSPDGSKVAYVGLRSPGSFSLNSAFSVYSLKVKSLDTGNIRQLRDRMGRPLSLRWTPDGNALVISLYDGVRRVDVSTGESSMLLPLKGTPASRAELSADGKSLYYSIPDPGPNGGNVFIARDLATGKERTILGNRGLGGLNLSPDRRYIACGGNDPITHKTVFMVIPVDGSEPHVVMRFPELPKEEAGKKSLEGPNGLLSWTPDSRFALIRYRLADGSIDVWKASVDGSQLTKLESKLDPQLWLSGCFPHPDGRRIVHGVAASGQVMRSPAQVMVLENFLPVPKQARP
jgi:Tol biopolymer transport system component